LDDLVSQALTIMYTLPQSRRRHIHNGKRPNQRNRTQRKEYQITFFLSLQKKGGVLQKSNHTHHPPQQKNKGFYKASLLGKSEEEENAWKTTKRAYARFTIPPMLPSYPRFRE